ncbi:MAG: hypothetical protein ACRED5_10780 [Propylenella sp.]
MHCRPWFVATVLVGLLTSATPAGAYSLDGLTFQKLAEIMLSKRPANSFWTKDSETDESSDKPFLKINTATVRDDLTAGSGTIEFIYFDSPELAAALIAGGAQSPFIRDMVVVLGREVVHGETGPSVLQGFDPMHDPQLDVPVYWGWQTIGEDEIEHMWAIAQNGNILVAATLAFDRFDLEEDAKISDQTFKDAIEAVRLGLNALIEARKAAVEESGGKVLDLLCPDWRKSPC